MVESISLLIFAEGSILADGAFAAAGKHWQSSALVFVVVILNG